jgi:hypothetical protein
MAYHEAVRDTLRAEAMAAFLKPVAAAARTTAGSRPAGPEGSDRGQVDGTSARGAAIEGGEAPLVLVATDRMSRGELLGCVRQLRCVSAPEQGTGAGWGATAGAGRARSGEEAGWNCAAVATGDGSATCGTNHAWIWLAVCAAGIDVLYCEHVILFDFPRDPSEYVRRVGRTARGAGGRGTVSSLVLGRQVRVQSSTSAQDVGLHDLVWGWGCGLALRSHVLADC